MGHDRPMCGIAGFLNFRDHQSYARQANRLQRHRGPDAEGIWSTENLSLAHRRLSIIDLHPRSNQPFERDGLVIIFNGEIYNYRELREELAHTVDFRTESDTEIVLEMFRAFGPECLTKFRGMFAFAIWSEADRSLFLARDHFGIKPLYYHAHNGEFAFASELKTLVRTLPVSPTVSGEGLASLLNYLWLPPGTCIFDEFRNLPPAHFARVDHLGNISVQRYWRLPESEGIGGNEDDHVERIDATLRASVKAHQVSDVEVGALLSGGLDSSLICALAAPGSGPLSTFTIDTDAAAKKIERMPDDAKYARQVSDLLGTRHNVITIRSDIVDRIGDVTELLDEPIGDPAVFNTYLICEAAREQGLKVLLSGMGADEIFFGYRRQKAWMLAKSYRRLPSFARGAVGAAVGALPVRIGSRGLRSSRWAKKFLSFADLPGGEAYFTSFSYYPDGGLADVLQEPWRRHAPDVLASFEDIFESRFAADDVNRLCNTDLNLFLPGLNLAYTDRASMAASTEIRVPFVDIDVVEAAMSTPGCFKYCDGTSKSLLKKVAERHLPKSIVHRPKANFGAPLRSWISNDLREMVDDLLSPDRLRKRGWVDPAACHAMIETDRAGKHDYSYQIYQLLVLELWAQATLDSSGT